MPLKNKKKKKEREKEEGGGGKGATSGPAHGCFAAILMSLTRADGVEVAGTSTAPEKE